MGLHRTLIQILSGLRIVLAKMCDNVWPLQVFKLVREQGTIGRNCFQVQMWISTPSLSSPISALPGSILFLNEGKTQCL